MDHIADLLIQVMFVEQSWDGQQKKKFKQISWFYLYYFI